MFTKEIFDLTYPVIEHSMLKLNRYVIDFAILGSSSGHYGWKEVRLCDFDLWIFCESITNSILLAEIRDLIEKIRKTVEPYNIILLAGAINGPYKPEIRKIESEDVLFLHILIDDKMSYCNRSIFTKLSWSKYNAYYNKDLLKSLLDRTPTTYDLIHSNCGILKAIEVLENRTLQYSQINLSTGTERILVYDDKSTQYIEYILHSIMMISRNRVRLMKRQEADILENKIFAEWYGKMYHDDFLRLIVEYKEKISNFGYGVVESVSVLERRAYLWLIKLKNKLEEYDEKE